MDFLIGQMISEGLCLKEAFKVTDFFKETGHIYDPVKTRKRAFDK